MRKPVPFSRRRCDRGWGNNRRSGRQRRLDIRMKHLFTFRSENAFQIVEFHLDGLRKQLCPRDDDAQLLQGMHKTMEATAATARKTRGAFTTFTNPRVKVNARGVGMSSCDAKRKRPQENDRRSAQSKEVCKPVARPIEAPSYLKRHHPRARDLFKQAHANSGSGSLNQHGGQARGTSNQQAGNGLRN